MNKTTPKYLPYPKPDDRRSGCKVSWYYYKDRAAAEACSAAAQYNARIQEGLGYDFGYQSPGSIKYQSPNLTDNAMWEVCLP